MSTSAMVALTAPFLLDMVSSRPAGTKTWLVRTDPPPALHLSTLPLSDCYTEGQHDLIQHMLWSTAHHESYFEKTCEAARIKKTEDCHSKHKEYCARDATMGRPHTPQKAPAVPAAATAMVIPIAPGGGPSTAFTAPLMALNPTAPSMPITGPSNVAVPPSVLTLPVVASSVSGSSSVAVPSPPCALSLMQEDVPKPVVASAPTIAAADNLINFLDIEDKVPLAAMKGKGKEVA
ncbi:hypothetical protein V8D89_012832 [Ganoderma adspersum]